MCNITIITNPDGHVQGVCDWTEGFKPLKCTVHKTENDFEAYLMRLIHLGQREVANDLLERYDSGDLSVFALIR
jgi:hypothetical protein